jgi:hypothetical protein
MAFDTILEWIEKFTNGSDAEVAKRAKVIVVEHFLPFMNRCFQAIFSYDTCFKPYFKSSFTYDQYVGELFNLYS